MLLHRLKIFILAVEDKSFSKTAEKANTTQSNISKQIAALEDEIGEKLFVREGKGVEPTVKALSLYKEIKPIVQSLDLKLEQFKSKDGEDDNNLVIGISDSMSFKHISPFITTFRYLQPNIRVNFVTQSREAQLNAIRSGTVDLSIIYSSWSIDIPNLERQALTRTYYNIYFLPSFGEKKESIEDFKDRPFVRISQDNDCMEGSVLPFTPMEIIEVDSMRNLQTYVLSGMAYAILGRSQLLEDYDRICFFPLQSKSKTGSDIVWRTGNKKRSLNLFLDSLAP